MENEESGKIFLVGLFNCLWIKGYLMNCLNQNKSAILCVLFFMLSPAGNVRAAGEPCHDNGGVLLEAHEPNLLGVTDDNDDDWFMDFKLSVQHPLFYEILAKEPAAKWLPYFAFTGRFGQYIANRPSAPVISKSYNPKLFIRYFLNGDICNRYNRTTDHIDFEYAHLSNGQSIDSMQEYIDQAISSGNTEYTNDYISRGWDYWGISGKNLFPANPNHNEFEIRYSLKSYVNGFMQGTIEEYYPWEPVRDITRLNQVSGVHLAGKYWIKEESYNMAISLDTGSSQPFKYNTWEINMGFTKLFLGMPIIFYYRTGYNSDLAQYYKNGYSVGFALEFDSFKQSR